MDEPVVVASLEAALLVVVEVATIENLDGATWTISPLFRVDLWSPIAAVRPSSETNWTNPQPYIR